MNKLAGTMMWPKSMQFIMASIAKILAEDNENIIHLYPSEHLLE